MLIRYYHSSEHLVSLRLTQQLPPFPLRPIRLAQATVKAVYTSEDADAVQTYPSDNLATA